MMNREERPHAEILSPAGGREAFLAALAAGADAVYLGGEKFGARAYAENFTQEDIVRTIREAHLFGCRIYLTANVLTRQSELRETVDFVRSLYEEGLDGAIVQDLGVAWELRQACPSLRIHASTQMSICGPEGVRFLKERGVTRVVPARELSMEEVRLLKAEDIEIEAFIHGAMCYAYSGRCLFSSFLGGRSGNRGRCAGTCRLPFSVLDGKDRALMGSAAGAEAYPLSMRDMCTLGMLPEILDAGVDSLKIEGRMKKPEYVAGVTALYRKYIDRYLEWDAAGRKEPWRVEEDDLDALRHLYIRADISEGYYHTHNGRDLLTIGKPGYAGADEALLEDIRRRYVGIRPQKMIEGKITLRIGCPAQLSVRCGDAAVTVRGDDVQPALRQPLSGDQVRERLMKTGETHFAFEKLTVDMDNGIFMPVSALNGLRRSALDALEEQLAAPQALAAGDEDVQAPGSDAHTAAGTQAVSPPRLAQTLLVLVTDEAQYFGAVRAGAGAVILDGPDRLRNTAAEDVKKRRDQGDPAPELFLAFPYVSRESMRPWYVQALEDLAGNSFSGVLVRTVEQLQMIREHGLAEKIAVITDASLYRWNRSADAALGEVTAAVLPHELNGAELLETFRESASAKIMPVYGRIPLMVSAGCVRMTCGRCTGGTDEVSLWTLEDRMGERFPVRCVCGRGRSLCYNVIYNSVPLSLHAYMEERPVRGMGARLVSMCDETGDETERIVRCFAAGRKCASPVARHTTGHYRKGAL